MEKAFSLPQSKRRLARWMASVVLLPACSLEPSQDSGAAPGETFTKPNETEPPSGESVDATALAQLGECTTTSQCRGIYGSRAVDCSNSGGGVCLCGTQKSVCSDSGGTGGSPASGGGSALGCTSDSSCQASEYCALAGSRTCTPDRSAGASCTRNAQCASNACTGGKCQNASGGGGSSGLRIAYSADGDYADSDDWGASPVSLAMLAQAGKKSALVHFDYCSNPRTSFSTACAEEEESVLGAQERFGYESALFFNDDEDLSGSVAHLKAQVNASTETSPLYLIVAGPMDVAYRALKAANASARQHVVLISHSTWNQNHTVNGSKRYIDIWNEDLVGRAVVRRQNNTPGDEDLPDQNPGFKKPESEWRWIENAANGAWIFQRIQRVRSPGCSVAGISVCAQGDASDAGMMYYVLTGDKAGTVAKLRSFYGL